MLEVGSTLKTIDDHIEDYILVCNILEEYCRQAFIASTHHDAVLMTKKYYIICCRKNKPKM